MRTITGRRLASTATAVAALAVSGSGLATAGPVSSSPSADPSGPSACRPADYRGVIHDAAASPGLRIYRVTLTAGPGTSACAVEGFPTDVAVTNADRPIGVTASPSGPMAAPTTLEPGRPVHFDVRVPAVDAVPIPAGGLTFGIPEVPGTGAASGTMYVSRAETQVGSFAAGA